MDIVGMRRGGSFARSWLPVRPPLVWSSPPDRGQPSCCADVTPAVHCYAKARCYRSFDENAVFNASSVATSALIPHWKFCRQLDKAMIHTSRRDRKAKATAEVLAMIDADLQRRIGRVLTTRRRNGSSKTPPNLSRVWKNIMPSVLRK
jgi:hypothetical protein